MKKNVMRAAIGLALLALACSSPVHADQGDVLARVRMLSVQPDSSTSDALSSLGVGVNNSLTPEADFTYMATKHIGLELILATTRHTITSNIGTLGRVDLLPPTLTAQWHFNPEGTIRPYAGAGVNYTLFYNSSLQAGGQQVAISNHSFGPALQAGMDVQVAKNVFVNFDVKKLYIKTGASVGGASLGTLKIDPLIIGMGVGMKF